MKTMFMLMLMATAAFAATLPAQAQTDGKPQPEPPAQTRGWNHKADMSSILCKELPSLSKAQVEQIVLWLQGYYTRENSPRVIDPDKVTANAAKLGDYCKQNPEANLVAAADDAIGE